MGLYNEWRDQYFRYSVVKWRTNGPMDCLVGEFLYSPLCQLWVQGLTEPQSLFSFFASLLLNKSPLSASFFLWCFSQTFKVTHFYSLSASFSFLLPSFNPTLRNKDFRHRQVCYVCGFSHCLDVYCIFFYEPLSMAKLISL